MQEIKLFLFMHQKTDNLILI